jgi:antitoxin CptB
MLQPTLSDETLRRLRWQCRRGLLENDLVLERFLAVYARDLDERRLACFKSLLQLDDNRLWDLISGREEAEDDASRELVGWLRKC